MAECWLLIQGTWKGWVKLDASEGKKEDTDDSGVEPSLYEDQHPERLVDMEKTDANKSRDLNTLNAAPSMCGTLTVQPKYGQRIGVNIVTLGKF